MIRLHRTGLGLVLLGCVTGVAFPQVGGQADRLRGISTELPELRQRASDPDLATEAVILLTGILDRLEQEGDEPDPRLAAFEAEIFGRALEYRSRAHLGRGDREAAIQDARTLLLLEPGWELDRADLTPAFVDVFEQERVRLVAWIQVDTTPPGATVFVDDTRAGETPLRAYPVVSGSIRVRIERAGFASAEFPRMDVLAGEVVHLERELERRGPVLPIITAPGGVTVRVDGRVAGTTAGALPEDLKPMVPPRFAGEEFSAPLQVGGLRIGAHEITLSAPCRQQSRFTFHADEARDYLPRFVRLRPSTGAMLVESEPSGARVMLDGEHRGATPLTFSALCAGRHEVEIRHAAGRCRRTVNIARDARATVSCEVAPLLRFVTGGTESIPDAEAVVLRVLQSGGDHYLLPSDDDEADAVASEVRVVAAPGRGEGRVELQAPGSATPDAVSFDRFDPESARPAVERLLRAVTRRTVWAGFSAGVRRIRGPDGVPERVLEVFSVHPEGPAVLAGMEPGDALLEVNGQVVVDEAHLARILGEQAPNGMLDIVVERETTARSLRIVLTEAPILPSAADHRCNRRLVDLLARQAAGTDDPVSKLETGICRLLLGDPEAALAEGLAGSGRPGDTDALAGVRHYYRGLALAALGERDRAVSSFEAALAVPGAYLVSPEGPPLAPLVRRWLRKLR